MKISEKFGMYLDEPSDYYDVERLSGNFKTLDEKAVLGSGVGTLSVLTAEEYEAAEKDERTLYIVSSGKNISVFLGELPLSAASEPANAAISAVNEVPYLSVVGKAHFEEV